MAQRDVTHFHKVNTQATWKRMPRGKRYNHSFGTENSMRKKEEEEEETEETAADAERREELIFSTKVLYGRRATAEKEKD